MDVQSGSDMSTSHHPRGCGVNHDQEGVHPMKDGWMDGWMISGREIVFC
jgi:hypothetical protein